jgi:hypothetical protein
MLRHCGIFFLITELYGNEISRMVEVGMLIILNCR